MKKLIVAFALCAGFAAPAFAQFETASVLGTVQDPTGAVVPGATVTLLSLDTGISSTRVSDGKGGYEFASVRIGNYKVSAELSRASRPRWRPTSRSTSAPASAWTSP